MNTDPNTPTPTAFVSRIPFGSLTNRGVFDRFENWRGKTHVVFKTSSGGTGGWPIKGEVLTALDAKLIGGEYALNKVRLTTPEQAEQDARKAQANEAAFYQARPDLINN